MKKSIRDAVEISSLEVAGVGEISAGIRVVHPKFGHGTVKSIWQFPEYVEYRHSIGIEFDDGAYRGVAPEFAKLELAKIEERENGSGNVMKKPFWKFWR